MQQNTIGNSTDVVGKWNATYENSKQYKEAEITPEQFEQTEHNTIQFEKGFLTGQVYPDIEPLKGIVQKEGACLMLFKKVHVEMMELEYWRKIQISWGRFTAKPKPFYMVTMVVLDSLVNDKWFKALTVVDFVSRKVFTSSENVFKKLNRQELGLNDFAVQKVKENAEWKPILKGIIKP